MHGIASWAVGLFILGGVLPAACTPAPVCGPVDFANLAYPPCMMEARFFVRTWYEWLDGAFQQVSEPELLPVEPGQEPCYRGGP